MDRSEKIVAGSTKTFILIGDETKMVKQLGEKAPIPVEVIPFGYRATVAKLESLFTHVEQRMNGSEPFITDNGNYILHCHITPPIDAHQLATAISIIPGVLEHGLFLNMAKVAYVATQHHVLKLKAS